MVEAQTVIVIPQSVAQVCQASGLLEAVGSFGRSLFYGIGCSHQQ